MNQDFWQGIEQFNQQDFYACHDTLEGLWMEAIEPQKQFYQGILQIAVACYHLGNANWRGGVILLGEGIRRLRDYQPIYEEIDVTGLIDQSVSLLRQLQSCIADQNKGLMGESSLTIDEWPSIRRLDEPYATQRHQ